MKAIHTFSLAVLLILGSFTMAKGQTYYQPDCYMANCNGYYQGYYQQQPGYFYTGGVSLSQTNITLDVGQVATVFVYGGSQRSTATSNWGVAQHSLFNNILTVQGTNSGTTDLTVCADSFGYYQNNCASLHVTVRGQRYTYPYNNPYYNQNYLLDQTSIRINKGDREELDITTNGNSRDLYVSDNSDDRIASARISGDTLIIRGLRRGETDITVCDDDTCSTVTVTVRD